jgi:hypothetical protein
MISVLKCNCILDLSGLSLATGGGSRGVKDEYSVVGGGGMEVEEQGGSTTVQHHAPPPPPPIHSANVSSSVVGTPANQQPSSATSQHQSIYQPPGTTFHQSYHVRAITNYYFNIKIFYSYLFIFKAAKP